MIDSSWTGKGHESIGAELQARRDCVHVVECALRNVHFGMLHGLFGKLARVASVDGELMAGVEGLGDELQARQACGVSVSDRWGPEPRLQYSCL